MNLQDRKQQLLESVLKEGMITIFMKSKPIANYSGDKNKAKKEVEKLISLAKSEKYTVSDSNGLYFPDFVWAGGKQQFGPSVGVLIGSDVILVKPINNTKKFKISEPMMASLVQSNKLESYLVKLG